MIEDRDQETRSLSLPVLTPLRGKLTSRPHTAMSEGRTRASGICQRICKADVFDETFAVNSAFNAEVFVAATHAVAMEFDLFGERRSGHWVKGGVVSKGNFWLDSEGQESGSGLRFAILCHSLSESGLTSF